MIFLGGNEMCIEEIKFLICFLVAVVFWLLFGWHFVRIAVEGHWIFSIFMMCLFWFSFICVTGFVVGDLIWI